MSSKCAQVKEEDFYSNDMHAFPTENVLHSQKYSAVCLKTVPKKTEITKNVNNKYHKVNCWNPDGSLNLDKYLCESSL